jgi:hypothetical protein
VSLPNCDNNKGLDHVKPASVVVLKSSVCAPAVRSITPHWVADAHEMAMVLASPIGVVMGVSVAALWALAKLTL